MKTALFTAIALVAFSAATQAQTNHQQHHSGGAAPPTQIEASPPMTASPQPPLAAPGQPPAPTRQGHMMHGMPGMMSGASGAAGPTPAAAGQGGMMMNCPMMRGSTAGMMGGHRTAMGSGGAMRQGGGESLPSLALKAVNERMHRDMAIDTTGDVDADFTRAMIAHHLGAIDMARIVLAFGKDPAIRKLAEEVVRTQEAEVATMRDWIAKQPR